MKRFYLLFFFLLVLISDSFAQHSLEKLDRGLVAVNTNSGIFASWRIPGEEWHNVTYNIYRDGVKLNETPLEVSNFTDPQGTTGNSYTVAPVMNGIEQPESAAVSPWSQEYKEISLDLPPPGVTPAGENYSYTPNDISTGDLNGDGAYDIVVKWEALGRDNAHSGYTGNVYLDGYTLEGEKLWRIDLGINIRAGAHYTQFMVYDLDGDGIAEIACKTAPGTKDGLGNFLSKGPAASAVHSADYRNSGGYILTGPEYLTVFDGQTGAELSTVEYDPPRGNVSAWGDSYGNRVDRFLAAVAYLDGEKPSLVMTRGYYTRSVLAAYDFDGSQLSKRWVFDSDNPGNWAYSGQGNHNLSVADVDGDGKDEIIFGSCTIDDDGTGLYSTLLGHGDAMHVSDFDPYRKGLEAFRCLEGGDGGSVLQDAADGSIIIRHKSYGDCGRCMAANVTDGALGAQVWGCSPIYSATTKEDVGHLLQHASVNFRIYWDGDLLSELLDHTTVTKPTTGAVLFTASGGESNNGSKGTPGLQADLFGDWREELIYRTTDPSKIRIYTSTAPTPYRIYTLMHDRQYRLAIAWQNVAYNQPPHLSYFLGEAEGMTVPPPPAMNNDRLVYNGTGSWDASSSVWLKDGISASYSDGEHVMFDGLDGANETVELSETVEPSFLTVNSPGNYTLNATAGKLSGGMKFVKQGEGQFTLNGSHDFTGTTEVWGGTLHLDGGLTQSPVWVNLFGALAVNGQLNRGLSMRHGAKLYVGGQNKAGTLTVDNSLIIEEKTELIFDIYGLSDTQNDTLKVNGDMKFADGAIIRIQPRLSEGERIAPGTYHLVSCTGNMAVDIQKISLEGIKGTPASLEMENGSIQLVVKEMRSAGSVYWNGSVSNEWDLVNTPNFLYQGVEDVFVTGDEVIVNDNAVTTAITIMEDVTPSSLTFNNSASDFTISGDGAISGAATFTKKGTGKVAVQNTNSFTGKILVEEGILEVNSLPNDIDGNGAIGAVSDDPELFEINGGTFSIIQPSEGRRALKIGSAGATIHTSANVDWKGRITGGSLDKTGTGELAVSRANNNSQLVIKSGTVRLTTEEAQPGAKVVFEGGTLKCYDNGGSYSGASYPIFVDEGQRGFMYLDGRCTYSNTLTGKGILNLSIPWVRSDFTGNWSAFEGTINLMGSSWFRDFSVYGYGKSELQLASGATFTAMNGQSVQIGSITGNGRIENASTWEIGGKNEDFTFSGDIVNGNLNKVGSGIMIIESALSTAGAVSIMEGGIMVRGIVGGGRTGEGGVSVKNEAFIGGHGRITGDITVENGGTLYAGYYIPDEDNLGTSLRAQNVELLEGSTLFVNVDPSLFKTDQLIIYGTINIAGKLVMNNTTETPYEPGQTFEIVRPGTITGSFSSIEPATPGEGFVWDLSAFDTEGVIKVEATMGVGSIQGEYPLIYPNPSDGLLFINLPDTFREASIIIENLNGKRVFQYSVEEQKPLEIDLSHLDGGVYIVRIISGAEFLKSKIILK